MPGSLRDYAVDYDDDGKIDLAGDVDDAVGSVANYLAMHGWQTGDPVMEPAAIEIAKQDNVERALDGGISDRRTLESWRRDGIYADGIPKTLSADSVGVLMLEGEAGPGYWVVFNNWYVLTRYNRSRQVRVRGVEVGLRRSSGLTPGTSAPRRCSTIERGNIPQTRYNQMRQFAFRGALRPHGQAGLRSCPLDCQIGNQLSYRYVSHGHRDR